MAVKFLQSLVQRGATTGARVTGLDSKAFGRALPATWSLMHPIASDYRPNVMAEPLVAVSAETGAGRSQGSRGAACISFAINAKRAVLSGWPVSSVASGKARPGSGWRPEDRNALTFGSTQPALTAPGCGTKGTFSG